MDRCAAIAERLARGIVAYPQEDFQIEHLNYYGLKEIERIASEDAHLYPANSDLFYSLAKAASILRREVFPKPGVAYVRPFEPLT